MIDNLAKWVLPKYEAVDPHAEVAAEQAAAGRVEPVSAEAVLEALRAVPQAAPSLEAPAVEPSLERLSELDAERERYAGVPIPGAPGSRLLPPRQPQPATFLDPAALAVADRPTLEVRPVRETKRPEEFTNGLIQNPPPLDPSLRPQGWRR